MMVQFNREESIEWDVVEGEKVLQKLLTSPHLGLVGLLEQKSELIGYFVLTWGFDLEWGGRDAFLTELFLVEQCRGQGLGSDALVAIEEVARRAEARALHLLVRHDNAPAQRLYRSAGFAPPPRDFLTKTL